VAVKDETFWALYGPGLGAVQAQTLSSGQKDLSPGQWDAISTGKFCVESSTFADWKEAIETLCSISNDCDYPTQESLRSIFRKIDKIKRRVK
jgi:hypothetical protein